MPPGKSVAALVALLAVAAALVAVLLSGRGPAPPSPVAGAAPLGPSRGVASRDAAAARPAPLPAPPGARRGAAARRARIPILMYHVIAPVPPGAARPDLWVAPARFRRQMRALAAAGYHAITLRRAYDAWTRGAGLPRRPVVVSFDDGSLSHSIHAAPVLRALGWPGVLNLALDHVGRGGITAPRVRRLIADGWEVDSHTLTHVDLTTVGPRRLRRELRGSRRELRRRFGVPADFLCYPSGRFDPAIAAAAAAAGYRAATTTVPGYADRRDLFALRRVRVEGAETARALLAELATGRASVRPSSAG